MTEITTLVAKPLDLPLTEPFEISLGTKTKATNILVIIQTESGIRGYGEGSPIPAVTGETQGAALETAIATKEIVEGQPIGEYRRIIEEVRRTFPGMTSATFAVETALLDAFCRERDIAMSELYGGQPVPVETDLTIPILSPSDAQERAVDAADAGFSHLKIKTGTDVDDDLSRVNAVRDAAPDAELKIDANQGWSAKETFRFASRVESLGIDLALIEQPVPAADVDGLADVRHRVDIPIAADEAVFTTEDATRIVKERAADILNVKLGKSGPLASADIVSIAKGADLDLMVGCMLESAIGIHASAHLVAGSGAFSYVDLDGNRLLAEDVIPTVEGPIHDISGPGHGVTPNLEL
jgi:L-alanine-DL-glutamate epimerase-like enolase superfamily enzyme